MIQVRASKRQDKDFRVRLEIDAVVTGEEKKPWSFVPDQANDKAD